MFDNIHSVAKQRIQATKENQLTKLDLSGLRLTKIPLEVFTLTQLETLDLSNTTITTLPSNISQLFNLSSLILWGNRLTTLPSEIGKLLNLSMLTLWANELVTLPPEIGQLHNLSSLILWGNRLTTLPPEIGQLYNLSSLDLNSNKLTTLPSEIGKLLNLSILGLRRNNLTTLPPEITQLKKLETLWLGNNPLQFPPLEVLGLSGDFGIANIQKIQAYFRQRKSEGSGKLYEAKLLIVGEGGAGKTTLANKIKDSNYVLREEDTTHGIEVRRWDFEFVLPDSSQTTSSQPFRINIWDFGGQEIYHATHQFFLTKRSLYLLVADSRKEDTDFNYWLNVVALLSDNSPILIVKNEKQDRQRAINEGALRERFENLKGSLATNLADNRGLPEVLRAIQYHIQQLPHVGAELPKTWVRVRAALEEDSQNYIGVEEYYKICEVQGIKRRDYQVQLSEYLHDLGVCLHFQEDKLLKKWVILKPVWATTAVYRVLDDKTVVNKGGYFEMADLERIWHEADYADMHLELLQLMLNFKLCYRLKNSKVYLAPQLLSLDKATYQWADDKPNLLLRYDYEFMPKGILTQFIVATHRLIANQDWVWKNGVILEKEGTLAEIIEDYAHRKIRVRVVGPHKRDLLTIVNHELEEIHAAYNRLRYKKLTPCPCSDCKGQKEPFFHPVERLRSFKVKGIAQVQCGSSGEMVKVQSLLDDVVGEKERDNLAHLDLRSRELYQAHQERLHKLQVRKAKDGKNTPPEILIEIENIKQELERLFRQKR